MGSICKAEKACTINQDNGLTLAHTIAHEIAHTLKIPHNGEEPNAGEQFLRHPGSEKLINCTPAANERYVMAPQLETDVRRLSWSGCSKQHLASFLDTGGANCLKKNDPSAFGPIGGIEENLPLGALIDVDMQCRLKFGRNDVKACVHGGMMDTICTAMW